MLEITDLGVRYDSIAVLHDVALALAPGSFTALVGPNGAGKSSLLKAVAGLVAAAGEVRLDTCLLSPHKRFESIAYMPQDTGISSSLTVIEVVLLGRLHSLGLRVSREMRQSALGALDRFGLTGIQDRTLSAISGGQRQMVYLAQSLYRNPKVLLLDEPTAALDLRHQLVVLEQVSAHRQNNDTIVIAAMHDLSLAARFADRMIFLSGGGVVANGPPREVLNSLLLRNVYGVEADILEGTNGTLHVTPVQAVDADLELR